MHAVTRAASSALTLALAALIACSSDEGSSRPGQDASTPDVSLDTGAPDTTAPDTATTPDTADTSDPGTPDSTGPCNTFGCPCSSNADCLDELCVDGPDGRVCSSPCVTTCPGEGFACLPITVGGSDPFNACVPQHPTLCRPCRDDAECTNPLQPTATALCLPAADPNEGSFCASSCANVPCPDGYTCGDVPLTGGGVAKQCLPTSGLCACRPAWASMNLVTDCARETAFGACGGERTCGLDGLTACDAPDAAAEICDGLDNDCDGEDDDVATVACTIENTFGVCPGMTACEGGDELCEGRAATAELCNRVDDDCDGGTDEDTCADGLACTDDLCAGVDSCDNPIKAGFCVIDGQCVAENTPNPSFPCQRCVPAVSTTTWTGSGDGPSCFIGGECWPAGAGKPNEPCYRCRPDISTTSWSPAATEDQVACSDGLACTKNDRCTGGTCLGEPYSCQDGKACTDDLCDGAGGCNFPIKAGQCLIEGACYDDNQRADPTSCRVCDPAAPTQWSRPDVELTCDDGNACTRGDLCNGFTCSGAPYSCDDQKACTLDACLGNGQCTNTLRQGFCLIEGACYANGAPHPTNPCLKCDTALPGSWSPAANGTRCSDADNCTLGDTCQFGSCAPGARLDCDDGVDCTTDSCTTEGTCQHLEPTVPFEDCENGKDDDCDGITDEGMPEQCGDAVDNDCDAQTDESANTWGETFFARGWAETSPATIAIYTSRGDGTFEDENVIAFPDGRAYGIVAVGDFDADGFRDLVVETYNHGARTACGAGNTCGTGFTCYAGTCHRTCTQQADCGMREQCLDLDEFNGTNPSMCMSGATLSLVRERCPDGAVELLPLTTLDAGASVAAIIDANNDGHLDLVVRRNWALRSGYTLLNNANPGSLAFTRLDTRPGDATVPALPLDTATCTWVYALSKTSKDLDGDGRVDIIGFCNPSGGNSPPTLWNFKGRGDGSFERKVDLPKKPLWPLGLLTTNDFDGDGDQDILGGLDDDGNAGGASIILNLGGASADLWANAYQVLDVTPTGTDTSDAPGVGNGTSFDFTRDGLPDLLLAWAPDTAACSYVWNCSDSELAFLPNTTAAPCGAGRTCNASNQCVACTPSCTNRECGSDGCGGSCGTCLGSEVCTSAGQCVARDACVPNCGARTCGPDGCGGECGTCSGGQGCVSGQCQACTPNCSGKQCGDDGCGGQCAFFGAPVSITRDLNARYAESPTNAPPTAPGITILPPSPRDSDDLICAVTTPSYDLDPIRLEYRWFRSGAYAKDVGNKARVDKSLTATGQVWECQVRATDGVEQSPIVKASVSIF